MTLCLVLKIPRTTLGESISLRLEGLDIKGGGRLWSLLVTNEEGSSLSGLYFHHPSPGSGSPVRDRVRGKGRNWEDRST